MNLLLFPSILTLSFLFHYLRPVYAQSSSIDRRPPAEHTNDTKTLSLATVNNVITINNITTTTTTSTTPASPQNYTLRSLEPYTEYLVSLRVFNPQGDGPTATLAATTDEGVSSPPRNITIQRVANHQARVQWTEPMLPNGRILGYHIYVHNVGANLTEVKKYQHSSSLTQHFMDFTINNLSKLLLSITLEASMV